MTFSTKKVHPSSHSSEEQPLHKTHHSSSKKSPWVIIITIVLCFGIVRGARSVIGSTLKRGAKWVSQQAVTVISNTAGTAPRTDGSGHINALILGYGGDGHAGAFLTDSMMIASFDTVHGGVTFLSVPRDLYVSRPDGDYGKINAIFTQYLYASGNGGKDFVEAGSGLAKKLTEITGVPIEYYFMIDFPSFEKLVDSLGGVDVNVPYDIYDTTYPGPDNSFETFSISAGQQHLDGATALKYARSRHSTSDFARSLRQQQIIQALFGKIFSFDNITSPGRLKTLYAQYQEMVKTNLTIDELIGGAKYIYMMKNFSSFEYAVCGTERRDIAQPGCLLYTPPMDAFGSSVELPAGATPTNVSYYDVMRSFAHQVIYNNGYLTEGSTVRVLNGATTGSRAQLAAKSIANTAATILVKMGIKVFDIGISDQKYEQTTLLINGTGSYTDTIDQIKKEIPLGQISTGALTPDGPALTLILGADYYSGQAEAQRPLFLDY